MPALSSTSTQRAEWGILTEPNSLGLSSLRVVEVIMEVKRGFCTDLPEKWGLSCHENGVIWAQVAEDTCWVNFTFPNLRGAQISPWN